jgi:primary-amine oxidase
MAVPYGDPAGGWNWRSAFDVGEYGVGKDADPIVPGLDAPTNAVVRDEVLANENGRPRVHPAVVGFYERDAGILWKHVEFVDGEAVDETRRARDLVAFFVTTVGNYDYTISWIFHQDGSLEVEAGLSGIMLPQGVKDGAHDLDSAHLVAPNVAAPHHQHILSFRLDLDVDGAKNTVMEMNTSGRPMNPADNPHGNAMVMKETPLPSEKQAQRDINLQSARTWRVINRGVLNSLKHPVGYILVPGANSLPFLDPEAPARKRAGFMDHHVWVTRYRDGELYAAGDYPNQQPATGKGLPEWTANDEPLDDQDVVVWYTMNVTHIPRPEEWPEMAYTRYSFKLLPGGFFVGNPALDVPRP